MVLEGFDVTNGPKGWDCKNNKDNKTSEKAGEGWEHIK
jgi:hypothetical protein